MKRRSFLGYLPVFPAALSAQFDGKTLKGWSVQSGPESAFYLADGMIAASETSGFPAWLRYDRRLENFELEFEFFLKGWMDGGVYFSAPEHGHKSRCGFKISIFHQKDDQPKTNSSGAIFPLVAPLRTPLKGSGEWNAMKIRFDWPRLQVWTNGEVIHDLNVESNPDLRHKLRSGYLGFEALSYPLRFRSIKISELPSRQNWEMLYGQPSDLAKWHVTEPNKTFPARFEALGAVLRGDGLGNLTTYEKYKNFELQMYVRGSRHHNGGIQFRSQGGRDHYEIQLHDVEEAHYPTGSLYFFKRAKYPHIEPEKWALYQLIVQDANCVVRIDGETVLEYDKLEKQNEGFLELQAHQNGRWIEYKEIKVRRL